MFEIKEELKKLPDKPGVYIMRNENDEIIYVGKAIKLKNRVRQYFQSSNNHSSKIKKMVSNIDHFEYIITDSEVEALVLECNLIKENRPKYNTMLKDDKTYPFIKVTVNEPYPRVLFTRLVKKDKAKYFGPFPSVTAVKDIIDLLRKVYKIRTCNRNLPKDIGKERPCLYYHIDQCNAPCQGYVSQEEYSKDIDNVLKFLGGNHKDLIKLLEERMNEESEKLEFEKAIITRELLNSINKISIEQNATNTDFVDRDIIALAKDKDDAVVQTFFIRGGKLIGREKFYLTGVEGEEDSSIMNTFIKQFYSGTPYIPKEIYLADELEDEELLSKWLSARKGQKVIIRVPKMGQKERLVELAKKNAELIMEQDVEKIKREEARTIGALKQLSELLNLPLIKRIESFDISNTAGYESVGSMVVYEDGKPKRADYRKFKIKTVKGADDYASMHEVLKRRFVRAENESKQLIEKNIDLSLGSFTRYPDLILMDGGKGQVNIALKVMEELSMSIPVCGMVKDDNHKTDYLYFNNKGIALDKSSELFKLITRIQDETHRFAIEYHRTLRSNKQVKSILDEIPTIGDKRRRELMRYFKSIDLIKVASVNELKKIPSMNEKSANEVYKFFH